MKDCKASLPQLLESVCGLVWTVVPVETLEQALELVGRKYSARILVAEETSIDYQLLR